MTNNEEVEIPRSRNEQGQRVYRTHLTPSSDTRPKVIYVCPPAPLPIVFLPGIMGSNLRNKQSKDSVWRPPNEGPSMGDYLGAVVGLFVWGFRDPKERQMLLKPDDVEVDDSGPLDVGQSGLSEAAARYRGWGTAVRNSYSPIMARLEERLDNMIKRGELQAWWNGTDAETGKGKKKAMSNARMAPADFGEELGKVQPLTEAEIQQAAAYQFDVWCCGYNWLKSNRDSAEAVRDYIENTVLAHYRDKGEASAQQLSRMKVILVTHSMGGLVSRSLTQLLGYERVLGVVHGVQPATGAPAIYHHMRCGYEGIPRFVLGKNAGDVTAVVANAPGALELTPSASHRNGKPWLFLRDGQGNILRDAQGNLRAYPQHGDPYEEIYKSSAWYGLVPKQNEQYLDMSGKGNDDGKKSPRIIYEKKIEDVASFHRELSKDSYHSETYAHYAAQASQETHSWREVNWRGDISILEQPGAEARDNGKGSYNGWFGSNAPELCATQPHWPGQDPMDGGGDGTVPTDSGLAPGRAGITASFRHGNLGRGAHNTTPGYDHQESYNDARAQWVTLYSIAKLALRADWAPEVQ